jgi:hypothetical protein
MLLARDLHHHLVQVPLVSSTGQPAADLIGECLAEFEAPLAPLDLLPRSIMTEHDATGREDLVHVAQAQGKAEVEPNGIADERSRKAVAGVAEGGRCRHPARLSTPTDWRKPAASPQPDGARPTPVQRRALELLEVVV